MLTLHEQTSESYCNAIEPVTMADRRTRSTREPGSHATSISALFEAIGHSHVYDKNDVIVWDGDACDHVYLVAAGVVRCSKLLSDGRRQISRFVWPGQILELGDRNEFSFTAEAVTAVRIIAVSRRQFEQVLEAEPHLRQMFMRAILDELEEARDQMLTLGRLSASERVAHFLANIADQLGTDIDGTFELPMSRQDIADHLGLTIETVSRTISRFKRNGNIRLLKSSRISISDRDDFANRLLSDVQCAA